jgi:hypothetical protein
LDKVVRARFYQVKAVDQTQATFYDCLRQLWNNPGRTAYQDVGGGTYVRIERHLEAPLITETGYVAGEFVRQQTDNIPPVAEANAPLRENLSPLGHRAAFRYHPETQMLLLETRQGAVSDSRINTLIRRRVVNHSGFYFEPALSEDALNRLKSGTPRRATIRVAKPSTMSIVEDGQATIEENLAALENAFNGPVIEVTASWPRGDRNGMLSIRRLTEIFRLASENRENFLAYRVKLAEESMPIDMLAEQLKIEETLDLASDDVEANYRTRDRFLASGFASRMAEISRVYKDR